MESQELLHSSFSQLYEVCGQILVRLTSVSGYRRRRINGSSFSTKQNILFRSKLRLCMISDIFPNKFRVDLSGIIFLLELVIAIFSIDVNVLRLAFLMGSNIDFSLPSDNLSYRNFFIISSPTVLALAKSSHTSALATTTLEQ